MKPRKSSLKGLSVERGKVALFIPFKYFSRVPICFSSSYLPRSILEKEEVFFFIFYFLFIYGCVGSSFLC